MSKNHRLVEYFVSEFYMNKTEELAHIISPTFTFKSPLSGEISFKQYVEHVRNYSRNANVIIDLIESDDDIHFLARFTIELTNSTAKFGEKLSDKLKILVKNERIESVEVGFDASEDDINKFKNLL